VTADGGEELNNCLERREKYLWELVLLGLLDFIEVSWEVRSGIRIHGERHGMTSRRDRWLVATGDVAVTSAG
jgi:hypothetical protein